MTTDLPGDDQQEEGEETGGSQDPNAWPGLQSGEEEEAGQGEGPDEDDEEEPDPHTQHSG